MGFWGWVGVGVAVVIVFRLLGEGWQRMQKALPPPPRYPYVPEEQRCVEPVDTGDERCPQRATTRWGNRRVCDEHYRMHESWSG